MPECIYCRKIGAKNLFTREHVIPLAFGGFKDNFTLLSQVCGDCNQYFGDNLEIVLARGSYEAIARLEREVTPAKSAKNLFRNRVNVSLVSTDEGRGMVLAFVERERRLFVEPQPQVRFSSKSGKGFYYVTRYELNDPSYKLPSDADLSDIAVLANSDEMFQMLAESLQLRGIEFVHTYDEGIADQVIGETWVEGHVIVDRTLFRAIAKICFNYLAYMQGAQFALRKDLDPIRDFIRREYSSHHGLVSISGRSILRSDTRALRQTNGHLITVDWPPTSQHIFGQVSLFNTITYRIMLSANCSMVWRDIRSGHHFNIETRRIEKLGSYWI